MKRRRKRTHDDDFMMTIPDTGVDDKNIQSDDDDSFEYTMPSLVLSKAITSKRKKKRKQRALDDELSFDGLGFHEGADGVYQEQRVEEKKESAIMQKVHARMRSTNMTIDDDDDDDDDDRTLPAPPPRPQRTAPSSSTRATTKNSSKMEKVVATPSALNQMAYFSQMNLSRPLLKAIEKLGFKRPTPVQSLAIPHALNGEDVLVSAVTGSGKTAAFMLPILERLLYRQRRTPVTRVLVVTPTRELAAQCQQMTQSLACFTDIRVGLIVGGLSMSAQQITLRSRPDIIIVTPGRLIDHLRNSQSFSLEDVEILVLDEADRLLDKGFEDEIREIVKTCPRQRQSMLFSATLSEEVTELVNLSLNKPKRIIIDPTNSMVTTLTQEFVRIRQGKEMNREAIVLALCKRTFHEKTIIFFRSKSQAHRMMIVFGFVGLSAAELHGNLTQTQRLDALSQFRDGHVNYLLCTDLAARGLDIKGVETVINMDLPRDLRQYIHRVGRTARAGTAGRSVSLAGHDERAIMKEIVQRVRKSGNADVIKSRSVPAEVVAKYRSHIEQLEGDIEAVKQEERIERELRIAEMEVNKSKNLYVHRDEIISRPARTWFQTNAEKKASKLVSLNVYRAQQQGQQDDDDGGGKKKKNAPKEKKDPFRGLNRKKKRQKMMKMEMEREAQERKRLLKARDADAHNISFTVEQRVEHDKRKKKAEIRANDDGGGMDDADDVGVSAPMYAWPQKRSEFDQRYGKHVSKAIASFEKSTRPKRKKSQKGSSKYRRRRGK